MTIFDKLLSLIDDIIDESEKKDIQIEDLNIYSEEQAVKISELEQLVAEYEDELDGLRRAT